MKLKHIKLFENFQESELDKNMVFDWMPYDSKISDPIQETMPKQLPFSELPQWISGVLAEGKAEEVKEAGLMIAHHQTPNGGFNRVIVTGFEPLKMDLAMFNSNYEKVNEYKDIEPSSISDVSKGASLLGRLGLSSLDSE
jgi:hypothetical protein